MAAPIPVGRRRTHDHRAPDLLPDERLFKERLAEERAHGGNLRAHGLTERNREVEVHVDLGELVGEVGACVLALALSKPCDGMQPEASVSRVA